MQNDIHPSINQLILDKSTVDNSYEGDSVDDSEKVMNITPKERFTVNGPGRLEDRQI